MYYDDIIPSPTRSSHPVYTRKTTPDTSLLAYEVETRSFVQSQRMIIITKLFSLVFFVLAQVAHCLARWTSD